MKKIVFVSVADYDAVFVHAYWKDQYLRYIIKKEDFEEEIKED